MSQDSPLLAKSQEEKFKHILIGMEKELLIMKNKVHHDSINKLIDYDIQDDKVLLITEAQNGIPIFEWIL